MYIYICINMFIYIYVYIYICIYIYVCALRERGGTSTRVNCVQYYHSSTSYLESENGCK